MQKRFREISVFLPSDVSVYQLPQEEISWMSLLLLELISRATVPRSGKGGNIHWMCQILHYVQYLTQVVSFLLWNCTLVSAISQPNILDILFNFRVVISSSVRIGNTLNHMYEVLALHSRHLCNNINNILITATIINSKEDNDYEAVSPFCTLTCHLLYSWHLGKRHTSSESPSTIAHKINKHKRASSFGVLFIISSQYHLRYALSHGFEHKNNVPFILT